MVEGEEGPTNRKREKWSRIVVYIDRTVAPRARLERQQREKMVGEEDEYSFG